MCGVVLFDEAGRVVTISQLLPFPYSSFLNFPCFSFLPFHQTLLALDFLSAHRVGCESCLRLSSCLWDTVSKKCATVTSVGAMSRKDQWNHVATCDTSLPPSQQRVDRRDRSTISQAHQFVKLDRRDNFKPISAVEVEAGAEVEAEAEAETETEGDAESDVDTLAASTSETELNAAAESETELDADVDVDAEAEADAEADVESSSDVAEGEGVEPADFDTEGTMPITNKARFAQVESGDVLLESEAESEADADADSDSAVDVDSDSFLESESDVGADFDLDSAFVDFDVDLSHHSDYQTRHAETIAAAHQVIAGGRVLAKLKQQIQSTY